ncbi:MAG: 50S ribosomal protein L9 [Bacteroidota bacterium]
MEIILLKDLDKVGEKFDVVTVKPGYGRNYLIPQKLAIIANKENMARLDEHKAREEAKEAEVISEMQSIKDKIESKTFTIGAKAGTSGKIFGSVTTVQLAQVIQSDLEVEVDRRDIEMPEEEVKTLGEYTAQVKLHRKVIADIKFEVVAD